VTGRPPIVLDYESFQEPPTALFRDYLKGEARVRPFYEDGWDAEALIRSADRAAAGPSGPRRALAEALVAQQQGRGATAAAARAAQLADEGTAAIVTGQQPVLFGGPLFVLYKAVAAVKLAAYLESRRGRPVVPVFWSASEDHDFAEIRSVSILDESGRIRTLRYEPVREPAGQPASRIVLDETITALVAEAERSLPAGLHRDEAMGLITRCYRPGSTLAESFARLVSALVPGLVVLDPSDGAAKAAMATVMSRELREASPTSRLAAEAGQRLLAAGYHQQVPIRPGFLNLFVMMDGERRALGTSDGFVEVRGLGRKIAVADAVRMLEADPGSWSAGVLLRPLAQDQILPTAAYIGGRPRSPTTRRSAPPMPTSGSRGRRSCPVPASRSSSRPRPAPWRRRAWSCGTCRPIPRWWRCGGPARPTPAWRRPSPARARPWSARWPRWRRRWPRSIRRCARPPTPRAAGPSTRSSPSTRSPCGP
jgi:bacillithiol biosynthesis cysteine-adding enzyme BshC